MKNEIIVFLDGVSRTIAGVKIADSDTTITVENPVIVNAMPNQDGQMTLQLIPVFFREVLEDQNQVCEFEYQKTQITQTNISDMNPRYALREAARIGSTPGTTGRVSPS